MDDKHNEIFKSIAESIRNRNRGRQEATRQCARVLDRIIRPAIIQASKEIDKLGESIYFYPGDEQPYIAVNSNELRFICRGNLVRIVTKVGSDSTNDPVDIKDISKGLVVDKIAQFFSWVYDLELPSGLSE